MKLIITIVLSLIAYTNGVYVSVPTGNVITWYKWGVLQKNYGDPGLHFYNTISTTYQINDINNQKDIIRSSEQILGR